MKLFILMVKNLRRNKLRSALTACAVIALVAVFSLIVTVVMLMESFSKEKSGNVRVMVSDRYNMTMPMPRRHIETIISPSSELCQQLQAECDFDPERYTIWHFVILTLDKDLKDPDQQFFLLATLPEKIATMTDGLSAKDVDPRAIELMHKPPQSGLADAGIVMGASMMRRLKKEHGDVFKGYAIGHRDGITRAPIEIQVEIVAVIPDENRWSDAAFMDYAYLDKLLTASKNEFDGRIHYGFLEFKDKDRAELGGVLIEKYFNNELKAEKESTAFGRFMEPLQPMLRGVKYLLVPGIVIVMTVVLANTFSMTVRERHTEMAVLKVLGYSSTRIVLLVMGEALLVGVLAGLLGATCTWGLINVVIRGLPMTGFPRMLMPLDIFWWGPVLGLITALVGGILPALSARRVKVSQVFANVA